MDPNGGKGIPIFQRPKGIQFLQGKTAVSCVKNSDVGIGFRKHAWINPPRPGPPLVRGRHVSVHY